MKSRTRRLLTAGLTFAGVADAFYMLAFDEGLLEHLVCPFFGKGCEIVGRSRHNKHLGIPNAVAGAVLYTSIGALALWAGDKNIRQRPLQPAAAGVLSAIAATASTYLVWEQATKIHAYCFWCLTSTAISFALLGLTAPEAVSAAKELWKRDQDAAWAIEFAA